jgi:hypothetical protein
MIFNLCYRINIIDDTLLSLKTVNSATETMLSSLLAISNQKTMLKLTIWNSN